MMFLSSSVLALVLLLGILSKVSADPPCTNSDFVVSTSVSSGDLFEFFVADVVVVLDHVTDFSNYTQWAQIPEEYLTLRNVTGDDGTYSDEICALPSNYIIGAFLIVDPKNTVLSNHAQESPLPSVCETFNVTVGSFSGSSEVCTSSVGTMTTSIGDIDCGSSSNYPIEVQLEFSDHSSDILWSLTPSEDCAPIAWGLGHTLVTLCLPKQTYQLDFNQTDTFQVHYSISLAVLSAPSKTGTLVVDSDQFLLFDINFPTCASDEYHVQGLLMYGTDTSDFGVQLSEIHESTSSFSLRSVDDGSGANQCLSCGVYSLEAYACSSTPGGAYQVQVNNEVVYSTHSFDLATSYVVDLECFSSAPTASPSPLCGANQSYHELIMSYDTKAEETEWKVLALDESGLNAEIFAAGGLGETDDSLMCLECGGTYILSLTDCGGDGMCCAWGYGQYLLLQEDTNVIVSGGEFGYSQRHYFTVSCA